MGPEEGSNDQNMIKFRFYLNYRMNSPRVPQKKDSPFHKCNTLRWGKNAVSRAA